MQNVDQKTDSNMLCPCESGEPYEQCCGPFLAGVKLPSTAKSLMRSRYAAYVLDNTAYILSSWHPSTRPDSIPDYGPSKAKWTSLQIVECVAGDVSDVDGRVTFVARYKINGKAGRIHENSRFVKEQNRWFYVDGTFLT